jgi:hypothetical protein
VTTWISVKEKLPDHDKRVLVWQEYPKDDWASGMRIMRCKNNTWEGPGFGTVTHWMPLPEPPTDDKTNFNNAVSKVIKQYKGALDNLAKK